jgi:thioredoxin 1
LFKIWILKSVWFFRTLFADWNEMINLLLCGIIKPKTIGHNKEKKEMDFQKEILESRRPVLIEFWAPWCGYCRRLAPALDRLEKEIGDVVRIVRINVDKEPELTRQYAVNVIPSMILFRNGKGSEQLVNPPSQASITAWLKEQGVALD